MTYPSIPDGRAKLPVTLKSILDKTDKKATAALRQGKVGVTYAPPVAPNTPSAPVVTALMSGLSVTWDGLDNAGAALTPVTIQVHVSETSGFAPDATTLSGVITSPDSPFPVSPLTSETTYYVVLVAMSPRGLLSGASAQVSGVPEAVVSSEILDGIVTTVKLADDAVTNAKIAGAAVDGTKLADGSVSASKIVAGTIDPSKVSFTAADIGGATVTLSDTEPTSPTVGDIWIDTANDNTLKTWDGTAWTESSAAATIGDGSITAAKLADGSVSATKVAADAITAAAIADGAVGTTALAADSVTAGVIAAGAIGADELAANSVVAGKINAGAVNASAIAANAVVAGKIATGAVTAGTITTDAITADKVAAGAIGADELAANSVIAGKIAAGVVDTTALAADSVTATQIATGAVTADAIAANSIIAGMIKSGEITADKLAATLVMASKLIAGGATGQRIEIDGSSGTFGLYDSSGTEQAQIGPGPVITLGDSTLPNIRLTADETNGAVMYIGSGDSVETSALIYGESNHTNDSRMLIIGPRRGTENFIHAEIVAHSDEATPPLAASFNIYDGLTGSIIFQANENSVTIPGKLIAPNATYGTPVVQHAPGDTGTLGSQTYLEGRNTISGQGSNQPVGTAFIAPPSGNVQISWSSGITVDTASGFALCSFNLRAGTSIGAGTMITAANDNFALQNTGITKEQSYSNFYFQTGLTPGAIYNVRLAYRTSSGTTGTFNRPKVLVQPSLA